MYITRKRAKINTLSGYFNIPWNTEVEDIDGYLYYRGNKICSIQSKKSHDYFCYSSDGMGKERGKLIEDILKYFNKHDTKRDYRMEFIWNDEICERYRRKDHDEVWLWNHDFYCANLEDLRHILQGVNT